MVELLVRSSIRYLLLTGLPILVGSALYSRQLFGLLLPPAFVEGSRIAGWVALGVLGWHVTIMLQKLLEARQRTRVVFAAAGIAASANVGLNLILIPVFGYMGAAVVTAVSYGVQVVLVAILCGRVLSNVMPWRSIMRGCAAGAAMALVLLVGSDAPSAVAVIATGTLSVVVYATALLILREWSIRGLVTLVLPNPLPRH